tara:strand:- start:559 stop:723 length:165 start_codon:yes stop_codon:yes gene_type:complete
MKRIIRIKNPDCSNLKGMFENYSGLWRTLRVKAILKERRGVTISIGNRLYKLEA